ncbi:hypothetical protein D7B24_003298 [Verticillium nonalfalfae]|uniref:Uncharacterized protein n=1 Tax=Verticillium nonalfalfae TaxID=1051616 RepID=A0A3M9XY95_9PEZI|nr:uncharacterized protein D7B24_003298 [Verticillium nonalfalfae]RNJ52586.1 hypothetical protein D7B24_003298 [Verticillium nonalfalfae]
MPFSSSSSDPADFSFPSPVDPAAGLHATAPLDFGKLLLGDGPPTADFDNMNMDWLHEAQTAHTDFMEFLNVDSNDPTGCPMQTEREPDELLQLNLENPAEPCFPQLPGQPQETSIDQSTSIAAACLAPEQTKQISDGRAEAYPDGNKHFHSLPAVSATQLASMTPLEKQTLERWETGLQKCSQLRALDASTLECLWLERWNAAQAGTEVRPHTAETPKDLWQIPINTALVYPESHISIT